MPIAIDVREADKLTEIVLPQYKKQNIKLIHRNCSERWMGTTERPFENGLHSS